VKLYGENRMILAQASDLTLDHVRGLSTPQSKLALRHTTNKRFPR
jgi:hypothetical protein